MVKPILTDIAIGLTLLVTGFTGGYLYTQTAILERAHEVLDSNHLDYNAGDILYVASGYRENTYFDKP